MSPQQQVWSLVRRARTALEKAHALEFEIEEERISHNDPFTASQRHWEHDPLGRQLEGVLDVLDEVLS